MAKKKKKAGDVDAVKIAPPGKPVVAQEIAVSEYARQPECPECGCRHAEQIAAPVEFCDGKKIRTRHQCRYCGRTFCFLWEKSEYAAARRV
jgi:hypothetical protein